MKTESGGIIINFPIEGSRNFIILRLDQKSFLSQKIKIYFDGWFK